MKQLTLLFEAQDTWFFQELRPGNSLWLTSLFPPPVRVFEGAVRSLLQQVSGQPNALAGNLRIAGPWPCLHADAQWQRLYPWPLHILEQRISPARAQPAAGAIAPQRALLRPAKQATRCDLGWVRLPELPTMPAQAKDDDWQAPKDAWLKRDDFIALLADCQAHVSPVKLTDHLHRETRLGIARVAETGLSEEGMLFQTEHVRLQPTLAFAITLRVSPNASSGLADDAQELFLQQLEQHIDSGRLVRLGAEGRMARVTVLADTVMDEAILPPSFDGQNLVLVATSAMDFDGHWLPQDFTPDANQSGQAQSWSGIFHACGDRFNLRLLSAITGKRQVEGSTREGKIRSTHGLGQGARALVPAGSVWFGQLLHGDFKRLARARLGIGKKLGRGEFALATWKEGDA
ncbi:MAG: hypothetical protein RL748_2427 [Pseudomonadota bacterium]|jgi:hypothetical protein